MTTPKRTEIAERYGISEPPVVTETDTAVINSGPAVFANKMFATTMPQGMRLTFAEVNPGSPTPSFRTAVFLGVHDVAALADLLQRQLALVEQVDISHLVKPVGEEQ
ncbi:MAG: hypothetical protein JNK19_02870 [Tabrizicola sp.]|nr:hypothetical protein [Tabrizicola sp.]